MICESYQFDFPGRCYRFHHTAITHAVETAVLRAIAAAVEPVVVEALDEQHGVSHLVAGDEVGGAYMRDASHTRRSIRIDEAGLVAWFDDLTRRGEQPLQELSIADGWFAVDTDAGDVLQLHTGHSRATVDVVERHGAPVVRGPNPSVLVAPFVIRLLSQTSWLEIAVHWSAWTDPDGVGHACFQQLLSALATSGWKLVAQPSAEDLSWPRSSTWAAAER
jgi:hypothetical protein